MNPTRAFLGAALLAGTLGAAGCAQDIPSPSLSYQNRETGVRASLLENGRYARVVVRNESTDELIGWADYYRRDGDVDDYTTMIERIAQEGTLPDTFFVGAAECGTAERMGVIEYGTNVRLYDKPNRDVEGVNEIATDLTLREDARFTLAQWCAQGIAPPILRRG
ncbi:MAG: hypothetical protein GC136_00380 [Alphaproteobacteria bacterium]|nr:hypothetical protein [Alphaproteobacteria bacterium]